MLLAVGGVTAGLWQYLRTEGGRYAFDRLSLRVPVVGTLIREMSLATYAVTLGSLLRTGVPILTAMEATREVTGNSYIGGRLEEIRREVSEGVSLSAALKERGGLFPSLVASMVGVGEESGNLAQMLENVGTYYSREADSKIKTMTTLLEPVITVVMGLLVGFIVIAMLLPIFEVSELVG